MYSTRAPRGPRFSTTSTSHEASIIVMENANERLELKDPCMPVRTCLEADINCVFTPFNITCLEIATVSITRGRLKQAEVFLLAASLQSQTARVYCCGYATILIRT